MEQYDIFISYARENAEWAEKLEKSLSSSGYNVFLDKKRLLAGSKWEEQLKDTLLNSKNMIVLWSDDAKSSDWVTREMGFFSVSNSSSKNRLIQIAMNLEISAAYTSFNAIYDIKEKNAYESGATAIDTNLWSGIIQQIRTSIDDTDNSVPIRRVILTLTRQQVLDLNIQNKLPFAGPSLEQLLAQTNLTKAQLAAQYGIEFTDWKPFGEDQPIGIVLDEVLNNINKESLKKYRWEPVKNSSILTEITELNALKEILKKELTVIIVDPVAFYFEDIKERFGILLECLENKNALVMAFSFFKPSADQCSWRKLIQHGCYNFYETYFNPPIPSSFKGQLTANPLDQIDARRFIKHMISESEGTASPSKHKYL